MALPPFVPVFKAKELEIEGRKFPLIIMLKEKSLKILHSQVLLPFNMNNFSHAFLGSYWLELKLEEALDPYLPSTDEE